MQREVSEYHGQRMAYLSRHFPLSQSTYVDFNHQNEGQLKQKQLQRVASNQVESTLHSCIASFTFKHPNIKGEGRGTAFLISKDVMVTAAHNFYDKNWRDYYQDFTVRFSGRNGLLQRTYSIRSIFVPEEFINETNPDRTTPYDYAFFQLNEETQNSDFLTLGINFDRKKVNLLIYGYPSIKYFKISQKQSDSYQYGLKELNKLNENQQDKAIKRYRYNITTLPGQSGCPVVVRERDLDIVVAVHKGFIDKKFNYGRIISMDFLKNLQIWRKQCGGRPFQCIDYQTKEMIDFNEVNYQEMIGKRGTQKQILSKLGKLRKRFQPRNVQQRQKNGDKSFWSSLPCFALIVFILCLFSLTKLKRN